MPCAPRVETINYLMGAVPQAIQPRRCFPMLPHYFPWLLTPKNKKCFFFFFCCKSTKYWFSIRRDYNWRISCLTPSCVGSCQRDCDFIYIYLVCWCKIRPLLYFSRLLRPGWVPASSPIHYQSQITHRKRER